MVDRWRWTLSGNPAHLALTDGGDKSIVPAAIDVFEAEFEGARNIGAFNVERPSFDLPEIQFEPFVVGVQLSFDSLDGELQLVLRTTSEPEIVIGSWPTADHIVSRSRWWSLDTASLSDLKQMLAHEGIHLGRRLTTREVLWVTWNELVEVDAEVLARIRAIENDADDRRPFNPTLLDARLYPYQIAGATYLSAMAQEGLGALLADEMGLGKTMQALYVVSELSRSSAAPTLIVVPASTVANWEREFERFAPTVRVKTHLGARRTGDPRAFDTLHVVLTTYETATRDHAMLEMIEWALVILDEAQAIKNRSSRRSRAVKSLHSRSAIAITGTPIENSLTDMWSIFEFLAPDHLGPLADFESRFPDTELAAEQLSLRVAPLVIRRSVASVAADLPPRVDIPTPIYASSEIARLYEDVRSGENLAPLAMLTKLRQVCAGSISEGTSVASALLGPKFDRLRELIEGLRQEDSKALVFSSFIESIDLIANAIRNWCPEMFVETVDGRRSPTERQAVIDDFSSHSGPAVLVLNPRAAGVGLNIQAASYVVHFTPEWNPAIIAQASARAHRRGQNKPVFVYYLYYIDTVEDVMMGRLDSKRKLQAAGLSSVSDEPSRSELLEALAISPSATEGE